MWQSFVCAMIAAVTLQAINPFRTGKLVLFQVTYHSGWHAFELAPFAILGPPFEPVLRGLAIVTVFWSILLWMYRRRIFVRI